jgi:hypothetical protein
MMPVKNEDLTPYELKSKSPGKKIIISSLQFPFNYRLSGVIKSAGLFVYG